MRGHHARPCVSRMLLTHVHSGASLLVCRIAAAPVPLPFRGPGTIALQHSCTDIPTPTTLFNVSQNRVSLPQAAVYLRRCRRQRPCAVRQRARLAVDLCRTSLRINSFSSCMKVIWAQVRHLPPTRGLRLMPPGGGGRRGPLCIVRRSGGGRRAHFVACKGEGGEGRGKGFNIRFAPFALGSRGMHARAGLQMPAVPATPHHKHTFRARRSYWRR
jgi:hypothetical protein